MARTKIADQSKYVSILGLGWLGLPLARTLHGNGFQVKGAVRTAAKRDRIQELPFEVHRIALHTDAIQGDWENFLDQSEILIINIPPGRQESLAYDYPTIMDRLIQHTPSWLKVIFASTTGVYADENETVNERTTPNPFKTSSKSVFEAEQKLAAHFKENLTILRLAGLIGEDRHPGRFLASKKDVKNGDAPVNLVHQEDCIGVIQRVIEKKAWGKVINVCASEHPLRKQYYRKAASALGLEPPEFEEGTDATFKVVDNTYGRELLDYNYIFDNPEGIFI